MGCCVRALPILLLHVNLLLMLFAGAALSLAARLKWDPSLYLAVRELFPREYRALAAALPAAAGALLLLAHAALVALHCRRARLRRLILVIYASAMAALVAGEAAAAAWLAVRGARWAHGAAAAEVQHALQLREHVQPLLEHLAYYHPLPQKVKDLIQEAEDDLPRNAWVCGAAAVALLSLQLAAVALAAAAAACSPRRRRRSLGTDTATTPLSIRRSAERAPLRAVYKNGRLVMV